MIDGGGCSGRRGAGERCGGAAATDRGVRGAARTPTGGCCWRAGRRPCPFPGVWQLPGGGLEHAEHPADAVVREFAEETGLTVAVGAFRAAVADVATFRDRRCQRMHTDRLIFDVDGDGRSAPARSRDGGSDAVAWFTPGRGGGTAADAVHRRAARPAGHHRCRPACPGRCPSSRPPTGRPRQRFGAYGLVTDPPGRVLLTHDRRRATRAPAGGTCPVAAPITASSRSPGCSVSWSRRPVSSVGWSTCSAVDNLHNPAALGPEGRPLDWHGVRVVYRVRVDVPTERGGDRTAGGSTARAAWFTPCPAQRPVDDRCRGPGNRTAGR